MGTGAVTKADTAWTEDHGVFPMVDGPAHSLYMQVWWATEKATGDSAFRLVGGSS